MSIGLLSRDAKQAIVCMNLGLRRGPGWRQGSLKASKRLRPMFVY